MAASNKTTTQHLVPAGDLVVGNMVRLNTKAKPTEIVQIKKEGGFIVIQVKIGGTRSYLPDEQLIQVVTTML